MSVHDNIDKARDLMRPVIQEALGAGVHPAAIVTAMSSLLGELIATHWATDVHEVAFKQVALNLRHAIVNRTISIEVPTQEEINNVVKH